MMNGPNATQINHNNTAGGKTNLLVPLTCHEAGRLKISSIQTIEGSYNLQVV